MAMKNPPHPGELIRESIFEPLGLTGTGAANQDRSFPLRDQRVDLCPGQFRIPAGAELLINRNEAQQPVLKLCLPDCVGRATEDLQTLVDLNRVAVDCDRVLPTGPQQSAEFDRHAGLAGAGRTEDRDQWSGTQAPMPLSSRSVPVSVFEVAELISTSTICPDAAVPSKLTALL